MAARSSRSGLRQLWRYYGGIYGPSQLAHSSPCIVLRKRTDWSVAHVLLV